jgi:hypothetical protein
MNRGLLVFSFILILLGLVLGVGLVSIFGFLLLFPALLSTPKPRPQGRPTGWEEQAPIPAPVMETPLEPVPIVASVSMSATPKAAAPISIPLSSPPQISYSAPLFPTSIFPSLSQQMSTTAAPKEAKSQALVPKDEILELGALLALMKLVFG